MFNLRVVSILEAWQALENKFLIRELGQSCLNLFEAMNKHILALVISCKDSQTLTFK